MTQLSVPGANSFWTEQSEGELDLKQTMEDAYARTIQINQAFWAEANTDAMFRAGDQTIWNRVYGDFPSYRRKVFNFNRIRRICNMVSGYQRRNRKSTIAIPIENSDNDTADQLSKVLNWAMQRENVLETISQAFDGAITTGLNLLAIWMDYREDPINGVLKVDNVSYNGYLIDPFFKKHDLSDCNFIWTRKWMTKTQLLSLFPDKKDIIESFAMHGVRDGKFQFMPESQSFGSENLLTCDEYWYRDYRKEKLLVELETGATLEWEGDAEGLRMFLHKYPNVAVTERIVPTCKLGIVVQGTVLYHGKNPLGTDKYPFVPVFCYYDPELPDFSWRLQGIPRGLKDSQFLFNRRKVIELDILESQINSGWKYKENALVNPKDVFLQGQGKGLALKTEAMMTDVEQIKPPEVPSSMIELSKALAEEIQQISGVNEELMGSAEDDKAGVLSMLRQGAGLTTLQILFDQLDMSQKLLGRVCIDIIQSNFTFGKVRRILGAEPTAQFSSKAFGKYDAAVEEGLNTTTQRQMQFAQLLQLKSMGLEIPSSLLINSSTLQGKNELIQAIEDAEKQKSEADQLQIQLKIKEQQALIKDLESRAQANIGLGLERSSRVEENRALAIERVAEAEKDREQGSLEKIKALKELDTIDVENLEKLLNMWHKIQDKQRELEDREKVLSPNQEEKVVAAKEDAEKVEPAPDQIPTVDSEIEGVIPAAPPQNENPQLQ